ncbi:fumarylacetoacetate hydrolase family protein [Paracoccus sulfuroxidans]|uniref:Fumarylacetoacetate (FAA) hydrolase family protein n=1 Tax=Paracoccus sulfuroxidans TaxID=384678 RepID=A0A562NGE8_9RHOB|nr:fumarylacetoacetate hydrolase family protein [Paracoccus sulfuroxidans]TWI31279.1 fumarylacetoacetate (FAA) hydrolase family protein [Paracoccus sulfuroxidans]
MIELTSETLLPADPSAQLLGRVWSNRAGGPVPVMVDGDRLRDLSQIAPTVAELLNMTDALPEAGHLPDLGPLADYLSGGAAGHLLAPNDLQVVKAAGVTFVASMLERVIDERTGGDATRAAALREDLRQAVGGQLESVVPGSAEAQSVKALLQRLGYWSQYLEVGIGPEAEIFTKAPVLASVGAGADVGINRISDWNNPEPEVVLAVNGQGVIRGATLGNDVNLRDVEGRSALLLGKAKDNNGSCAIGPFIRLFDAGFGLEDVARLKVSLTVLGEDGFHLEAASRMDLISRSPADLAGQAMNRSHQYPDGFMLFLGTMFAPVQDRDAPGRGFTHKPGDIVTIHAPELGRLINRVDYSDVIPEWKFGITDLMRNLALRGLL